MFYLFLSVNTQVVTRQVNVYDKRFAGNFLKFIALVGEQDAVSVWRPRVRPGEFVIAYVTNVDTNDDQPDFFTTIIEREVDCSEEAVVEPASYKCQWSANNDDNFAFWRPICPEGYVSLSDVVEEGASCEEGDIATENPDIAFRCVHENTTVVVDLGRSLWDSKGISDAATINSIGNGNQGFRIFQRNGDLPGAITPDDTIQHRISSVPAPLYKDLAEVLTLTNPSAIDQRMKFSLQRGLTSTKTTESTISSEFRADFEQKVSAGAEAASSETSISFGFTLIASSTISQSDVISTTQTTEIDITVPAMSTAKLAQLVVVDNQLGSAAAATTLFTSNYALEILPFNPLNETNTDNANTTGVTPPISVTGNACADVALDTARLLERQSTTNVLLDSNGDLLRNVQNNVELEKNMLQIILDLLKEDDDTKKSKKGSRLR